MTNLLSRFWRFLWPKIQITFRVIIVGAILAGAWNSFMWLVGDPPIDTTPALVMIWASVAVLLLALFPKILDRVKRVKVKDFELELQETVAEEASTKFILASDLENRFLFTEKGDFRTLQSILGQVDRQPNVPVLLVVNVENPQRISISMLFTYLFFLDIFSLSTIVLFVSKAEGQISSLTRIDKSWILGATTGKKALWVLYKLFPSLLRATTFGYHSDNRFFSHNDFARIPSREFIHDINRAVRNEITQTGQNLEEPSLDDEVSLDNLSSRKVNDWFGYLLSSRTIDTSLSEQDVKIIRAALESNDDFILAFEKNDLKSVIIVCELALKLSKRALANE